MRERSVSWAVVLGALALLGPGCDGAASSAKAPADGLRVVVVRPEARDMVRRLSLPGDVEGIERAALHARTGGTVREVRADVGDVVSAGQVLLVVEAPEVEARRLQARAALSAAESSALAAEAALPRARAHLTEAEVGLERSRAAKQLHAVTFERLEGLISQGGVTRQELDEAQAAATLSELDERAAGARVETARTELAAADAETAEARAHVEVARATLAEAEALLALAELRAPFDGVVVERRADPGTFVPPPSSSGSQPLFVVTRADVVRVWVDVPENDARFLEVGRAAQVSWPGSTAPMTTEVSRFAGALDAETRTLRVAFDVPVPAETRASLRPGTWARVRLDLESRPSALTLPAEALIFRRDKVYVFVVEDGKAHRKRVQTGADDGQRVEVLSGIDAAAQVVTEGKSAVTENAVVVAVPADQATTGQGR